MNPNTIRLGWAALALHPRCGAHCRTTGKPCRGMAMKNGRCRMHGGKAGRKPTGGPRSKAATAERRRLRAALKALKETMGVVEAKFTNSNRPPERTEDHSPTHGADEVVVINIRRRCLGDRDFCSNREQEETQNFPHNVFLVTMSPNAGPQPRLPAAARDERRLADVGCRPMLGREARPPWPHPQPRVALWAPPKGHVQPQEAPFDSDPGFSLSPVFVFPPPLWVRPAAEIIAPFPTRPRRPRRSRSPCSLRRQMIVELP